MLRRGTIVATLAVTLLLPAVAGPAPVMAETGSSRVKIDVDRDGGPEEIEVTNRSKDEIKVESVTSLVERENREPINVNERLKRGQSLTLESGADAGGGDALTERELFDDEANREGVKVKTSIGTFKERC